MTNIQALKKGFFEFVKIRDFPIFHCFECKLYLYLRRSFIYSKSLQLSVQVLLLLLLR